MKKVALIFLLIVFLLTVVIYSMRNTDKYLSLNGYKFKVEVVTSNADMQKGLGSRKELCQDCAMLFDFKIPGDYAFWMKDMNFPLDIIWLNEKSVVYIEKNISATSKEIYKSNIQADQVIEMNAGLVDKYYIKIGDQLQ